MYRSYDTSREEIRFFIDHEDSWEIIVVVRDATVKRIESIIGLIESDLLTRMGRYRDVLKYGGTVVVKMEDDER